MDGQPPRYKSRAGHPDDACPPSDLSKDSHGRSSFSSIREDDTDLAQAFTASKVSSYSLQPDSVLVDDQLPSMGTMVQQAEFFPPVTRPNSRLHGNWFPADNFKGWKQINVKGRLASRSFGDLHSMNLAWTARATDAIRRRRTSVPGDAPIERLPLELLSNIIGLLVIDVPPNSVTKRNIDLMSLLLTSKKMHGATLVTLYRQITIPHSAIFKKFLNHVSCHAALGTLVRRFDFSHFNPSMMFTTASERSLAQNLTASTLLQALELTPHLQEFLAQEHIDGDIDVHVLRKLLFGLDRITALDFCGCTATTFRAALIDALPPANEPRDLVLKRLSLHKCTTLPSTVFENLLPRLPNLTHLDVAGTRITDTALASIPHTARLTHLNLAKCNNLSADAIIKFLSSHPAVAGIPPPATGGLVFLSLSTDASTHETFDENAVTRLLPTLPESLKSLSLKGSRMTTSHIKLLLPLTKHLEELALGRGLTLSDINALFVPSTTPPQPDAMEVDESSSPVEEWQPHTLHYLDVSDLWSTELNIPTLYDVTQCALLTRLTEPLEVVEVSADVGRRLRDAPLGRLGWRRSEIVARTWIVRDRPTACKGKAWKMGAESWGMRKVPVARADVGGMYGSYMFARRL
ncbi:hypothetical protein BD289DRAFT_364390 [Coniella lustricola]|uniref:Leucine Rich Repeat domain protein n=1 Tax=Coniella lustricola TaxID=2025994 RepID=A0A2T3ADT1_9PEZI|nr:hypothetical protein BD289DRAFT_364390 [Coniella lustricola]